MSNLEMFRKMGQYPPGETLHYLRSIDKISGLLSTISTWRNATLSWYALRHLERHMSIASKTNENRTEEEFFKAIYFSRTGKSTSISPVYLDEKQRADIKTLATYFDRRINLSNKCCQLLFRVRTAGTNERGIRLEAPPGHLIVDDLVIVDDLERLLRRQGVQVIR